MLTFRVLGQLDITHDGAAVRLPTLMLRKLAAALLCQPDDPVAADVLADAIWEGNPPPTARKTLQIYVHRLRRALGGEGTITRGPAGYRISLDGAGLDSVDFARLLTAARTATVPDEESGLLRRALELWRGPAFGGSGDCSYVEKYAALLEAQRLQAIERYAEIELRLGRADRVTGLLAEAAAANPYREVLRAHLMLALYRSGRQAEALEQYQLAHQLLAEDLGIDPGPELQGLHERILRNDPRLAGPTPAGVLAGGKPNFLPGNVPGFTGRAAELSWLDVVGDSGQDRTVVISAISGTGGVGKTALAIRWAHRASARYPDGQFYVNLHGHDPGQPMPPLDALTYLLRCLDVAPERIPVDLDTAAALYRSRVAGRRMMIVLDDARTAAQVRPLLPGTPSVLTLVTSRDRLSGLISRDGARRLTLNVLPEAEAISLLREVAGRDRIDREPESAQELVRLCSALPLAVRIAGAHLADHPGLTLAEYTKELTGLNRAEALAVAEDQEYAVHAVLKRSYDVLPPAAQRVLRLLGSMPGTGISAELVCVIAEVSQAEATSILDALRAAHLLEQPANSRFGWHDIIREFARSITEPEAPEALRRFYGWSLSAVCGATETIYPGLPSLVAPEAPPVEFPDAPSALRWLDDERDNLLAAIVKAAELGLARYSWLLTDALRGYMRMRQMTNTWLQMATAALAAAVEAGSEEGQSAALLTRANAYSTRSRNAEAVQDYNAALALARSSGWLAGQASALNGLGLTHLQRTELALARSYFREGIPLAEAAGRKAMLATLLNNLSFSNLDQEPLEESVRLSTRALKLHRELKAHLSGTYDLIALALAYENQGHLDLAIASAEDAARTFTELGDKAGIAGTYATLSTIFAESANPEAGRKHAEHALRAAREAGNPRDEAIALRGLSGIDLAAGQPAAAIGHAGQSLSIATAIKDPTSQIFALLQLAWAYLDAGRLTEGLEAAGSAYAQADSLDLYLLMGRALTVRAALQSAGASPSTAIESARAALAHFDRIGENLYRPKALAIIAASSSSADDGYPSPGTRAPGPVSLPDNESSP
jgi:DNA-binding SARP family transcriptional activator